MTFMARKFQVWATLSDDLYRQLESMAANERRNLSAMAAILLENAIKERQRQRKKNAKED